ncbi:MAG: glycosyltransferase [Dehalococcoidales bacterium]|nr:glycosyltransferase [Dehalococcoidales bacterium]
MLQLVDIGVQSIDAYSEVIGKEGVDELRQLAEPLKGKRIAHISSTPYGGGVSELLRSTVPLQVDLGLDIEWQVMYGDESFFGVTKAIHNLLQGAEGTLSERAREIYLAYSARNAMLLERDYDYVVVHDPQPAALLQLHGQNGAKWVWRCHIDTSRRNQEVWQFLRGFVEEYNAAVFTMKEFVPDDIDIPQVTLIAPAIDPLSPKNLPLPSELAWRILDWIGVDIDRPLVTQVSRFDPWKDPLGVIDAYKMVRRRIPGLQLALVGSMALDDPEGWGIYNKIVEASKDDPGIRLYTNLNGVGNVEVNAFQRFSSVVIQKSIREGFGLVVAESLWKSTPVVARRVGGIPQQMADGEGGFLVDTVEETADRVLQLLEDPRAAAEIGARGQRRIAENFLITRLIKDELQLLASL